MRASLKGGIPSKKGKKIRHEVKTQNITTVLGTKMSAPIISVHYSFVEGQSSAFSLRLYKGLGYQVALISSLTSWPACALGSDMSTTSTQ